MATIRDLVGAIRKREGVEAVVVLGRDGLVIDSQVGTAYVYHAGQFARTVEKPGDAFWAAVRERRLPGAVDEQSWARLDQ